MLIACLLAAHLQVPAAMEKWPNSTARPLDPKEAHLRNLKQVTFGGQNAEAYWDLKGKNLIFQSTQPGYPDEQIFTMSGDGANRKLVSTGKGRCTCSYFSPDGKWLYFSSTHADSPGTQEKPDMSKGYVWAVYPTYAIYRTPVGGGPITPVLKENGYVAETTIAPNGKYMVFTSDFEGDLEIYRCDLNGKNVRRLTNALGYDGGPFVSWDSKHIVYRRQAVTTEAEKADYLDLLSHNLVRPSKLEIWIMDADGANKRQVTHLDAASFGPFLLPDNKRIIFSSNYGDPKGREFDLFLINVDGTGLERVTSAPEFDGFPMITRDGKKIVFASNRFGEVPHDTNIFVADWLK